jgi:predicted ATPase/DNA-binding NarL/FixJ family response regulator
MLMQLNTLPAQPTPLIGRERILERLVGLIGDPEVRLLTLTGPGGAGKTRLAIEVAEQVRETFDDGAHFVDLAPLSDPSHVLRTIARTLHFEPPVATSAAEQWFELFSARCMLLVLDNFEHLIPAATDIAQLLSGCRNLKVIVTSRESLRLRWEHVVAVPSLEVPDLHALPGTGELTRVPAVQLFVDRARQVNPGFSLTGSTSELVARLCVHLDGLPLSIELAAARTRALGVQGVFDRLLQRLDVLAGGARDQPARHRTLNAAINWSYELLSAREQVVFRRLAVFIDGWSIAGAEAVCSGAGIQSEEILDVIERLVERSLVQVEESAQPARFRLLETVRQFAAERLEASDDVRLCRQQHLEWYVGLADGVSPQLLRGEDVELLEHDYNNLRSALRSAIDLGDGEAALRLGTGLWLFWYMLGQYSEGYTWLTAALAVPDNRRVSPARIRALSLAAHMAYCQSDFASAQPLLDEAVASRQKVHEVGELGLAIQVMGNVARGRGDLEGADKCYAEALGLNREVGNWGWEAVNLHHRSVIAFEQGRVPDAEIFATESLALSDLHDHAFGRANALQVLGRIAASRRNKPRARELLEQSLAIQRLLRYRQGMILSLIALAATAPAQDDPRPARLYLGECVRLARDSGDRVGLARSLEACAELHVSTEPRTAVVLAGAADALRGRVAAVKYPSERQRLDIVLHAAAERMGRGVCASAFAEGHQLSLEDAVARAEQALTAPTAPSNEITALLSRRELEVAGLIGIGCTNRQIARELVITERTAEHHVENIMSKLGVHSRTEIGVWSAEHGLTSNSRHAGKASPALQ